MKQSNLAMAIMRVLSLNPSLSVRRTPPPTPFLINMPTRNTSFSRQKARSSFKQNRRLQMKTGNFKARF